RFSPRLKARSCWSSGQRAASTTTSSRHSRPQERWPSGWGRQCCERPQQVRWQPACCCPGPSAGRRSVDDGEPALVGHRRETLTARRVLLTDDEGVLARIQLDLEAELREDKAVGGRGVAL